MNVSGWSVLKQERIRIANRLRALLPSSLQACSNGLYEAIAAAPAPGSEKLFIQPHDHGSNGGTPIARGSHWTFYGATASSWGISIPVSGSYWWKSFEADATKALVDEVSPVNMCPDIPIGLDSSTTSLSSIPCALEAKVRVYLPTSANTAIDFKFFNVTTGTSSDVQTATAFNAVTLLHFTAIPIRAGLRNQMIFAAQSNIAAIAVDVLTLNLCSSRTFTQPESGGALDMIANPKP